MKLAKKLAQEFRKSDIRLEKNRNQNFTWIVIDNIAGISLKGEQFSDFITKYNSYKSTTDLPKPGSSEYNQDSENDNWWIYPDNLSCIKHFIDSPPVDKYIQPTNLYNHGDKILRIMKVGDNDLMYCSAKFDILLDLFTTFWGDTDLYTDSRDGYIHGFTDYGTEDYQLRLIISPVDTDPKQSLSKVWGDIIN